MRLSLLSVFFLLHLGLAGQDRIELVTGEDILGEVLEVGQEIRYRHIDRPDGPVYVFQREEVAMISYADGHEDFFNASRPANNSYRVREDYLKVGAGNRFYEGFRLISRQEFEQKLRSRPEIYEGFERGRGLKTGGYIIGGTGSVIFLAAAFSSMNEPVNINNPGSQPRFKGLGGMLAGAAALIGGALLIDGGRRMQVRAIDQYNIAIGAELGLRPFLTADGLGIALQF